MLGGENKQEEVSRFKREENKGEREEDARNQPVRQPDMEKAGK